MKTIIAGLFGITALGFLSNCTTVEQRPPAVRTTSVTTDQTTLSRPLSNSVETTTTRSTY